MVIAITIMALTILYQQYQLKQLDKDIEALCAVSAALIMKGEDNAH